MSGTAWAIVGGVVIVGGLLLWYNGQVQERERMLALQQSGLGGLGAGVDQSRQDVVAGLQFGSALAGLGAQVTQTIREQMARDAAAQQTRAQTTSRSTESTNPKSAR